MIRCFRHHDDVYRDNLADGSAMGEVSQNRKDDNSGKDGRQRVAQAHDKGVPLIKVIR